MRVSVLGVACLSVLALHVPARGAKRRRLQPAPAPKPAATAAPRLHRARRLRRAPAATADAGASEAPSSAGNAEPSPAAAPTAAPSRAAGSSESSSPPTPRPACRAAAPASCACKVSASRRAIRCATSGRSCVVRAEQAECVATRSRDPQPRAAVLRRSARPRCRRPIRSAQRHDGFMAARRARLRRRERQADQRRRRLGSRVRDHEHETTHVLRRRRHVFQRRSRRRGRREHHACTGASAGFALQHPDAADRRRGVRQTSKHSFVGAFLLAPAVTYYFMPINMYLTGAAGLSFMGLRYRDAPATMHEARAGRRPRLQLRRRQGVVGRTAGGARRGRSVLVFAHFRSTIRSAALEYDFVGAAVLFSATYQ